MLRTGQKGGLGRIITKDVQIRTIPRNLSVLDSQTFISKLHKRDESPALKVLSLKFYQIILFYFFFIRSRYLSVYMTQVRLRPVSTP